MTKDKNFKHLVRERMSSTGENFTSARTALLAAKNHAVPIAMDPQAEAFKAKTLKTFMVDGQLRAIPTKRKALVVILLEIFKTFEVGRIYRETDVNTMLSAVHRDFARLRRELIDYDYLGRDAHTGEYWVNSSLPARKGNLAQEAEVFETFLR